MIDNDYLSRVGERRTIMRHHISVVMGSLHSGYDAIQELYTHLLRDYLPKRYPTMFALSPDATEFVNNATNFRVPMQPPSQPLDAFRILGETIDDDLLLLKQTDEGHVLSWPS